MSTEAALLINSACDLGRTIVFVIWFFLIMKEVRK